MYTFGRGDGQDIIFDDYWADEDFTHDFTYQNAENYNYSTSVGHWSGTLVGTNYVSTDGSTTLTHTVQQDGGADTLLLGAGIVASDVRIEIAGNDLLVGVLDVSGVDQDFDTLSDVVRLQDWFNANNRN